MSKINFTLKSKDFIKSINTPNNQPHHNPFSTSFKGNELKADVFQFTAKKIESNQTNFAGKLAEHCENIKAQAIKPFLPIISFAGKVQNKVNNVKNNTVNTLAKLNSIELNKATFTAACNKINNHFSINNEVKVLMNKPVNELSEMLKVELKA